MLLFYFEIIVHDGGCCCCLFEKGGQKDHFEYAHELMEMQNGRIRSIDLCPSPPLCRTRFPGR